MTDYPINTGLGTARLRVCKKDVIGVSTMSAPLELRGIEYNCDVRVQLRSGRWSADAAGSEVRRAVGTTAKVTEVSRREILSNVERAVIGWAAVNAPAIAKGHIEHLIDCIKEWEKIIGERERLVDAGRASLRALVAELKLVEVQA